MFTRSLAYIYALNFKGKVKLGFLLLLGCFVDLQSFKARVVERIMSFRWLGQFWFESFFPEQSVQDEMTKWCWISFKARIYNVPHNDTVCSQQKHYLSFQRCVSSTWLKWKSLVYCDLFFVRYYFMSKAINNILSDYVAVYLSPCYIWLIRYGFYILKW